MTDVITKSERGCPFTMDNVTPSEADLLIQSLQRIRAAESLGEKYVCGITTGGRIRRARWYRQPVVAYIRDSFGAPEPVFVVPNRRLANHKIHRLDIATLNDQCVLRVFNDIVGTTLNTSWWDKSAVSLGVDTASWQILRRLYVGTKVVYLPSKTLANVVMVTNPWVGHIYVDHQLATGTCEASRYRSNTVAA